MTFIRDARFARRWAEASASAALVSRAALEGAPELEPGAGRALLIVEDADLAIVDVLAAIEAQDAHARPEPGVHPTAAVHATATVDPTASVGANAVIEAGAAIGARSVIGANVTVCRRCVVGADVIVHPGAVIGADGFGYVRHPEKGAVKIPHVGRVVVQDGAEIGANACIDRGKFGDTVIGANAKIDNLVQIGHNCRVGEHAIICGQSGLAGSVTLGRGAVLGASVGVADNLTVGDGAQLGARAGVMNDIPAGEAWIGEPAMPQREFFRFVATMKAAAKGKRKKG